MKELLVDRMFFSHQSDDFLFLRNMSIKSDEKVWYVNELLIIAYTKYFRTEIDNKQGVDAHRILSKFRGN